jgi:hypothetical protein
MGAKSKQISSSQFIIRFVGIKEAIVPVMESPLMQKVDENKN